VTSSRTSWISRIPRNRLTAVAAVVLAGLLIAGAVVMVRGTFFGPKTITAYFTSATAIYPGDQVRVSGVKVGSIKSIEPQGTQAKFTLKVDRDVPIPADAKAIIFTWSPHGLSNSLPPTGPAARSWPTER
jgi:phospholipid/cholesterol/gamma-HCH transport system substrate-binding protein